MLREKLTVPVVAMLSIVLLNQQLGIPVIPSMYIWRVQMKRKGIPSITRDFDVLNMLGQRFGRPHFLAPSKRKVHCLVRGVFSAPQWLLVAVSIAVHL